MNNNSPLKGLKVLELASVLAGPSVGMFFAELGAEVIKVENNTTEGDVTRKWKLPKEDSDTDISGYFSCVNWGKKSIALNLCEEDGLEIVYKLIEKSDIVLVSYKPGDAEKLMVHYEKMKELNPRIIYAHITGYGMQNPRAGFDAIIQAETGFTYMNGEAGGPPVKMPVALMDILAAHQLKEAILIALLNRERNGIGQYIEASLFRSGLASLANQATNWLVGNEIPQRIGSDHPNIVPYGTIFKTSDDKEIVLAVGTEKQFLTLVSELGRLDLVTNPKFAKNQNRVVNKNEINSILQELIAKYSRKEILSLLSEKKVPAGGVFNMQEVFESHESKDMMLENIYFDGREIRGVRSVAFSSNEKIVEEKLTPPPHYGQHTFEILENVLNLNSDIIENLIKKGVVYARNH
ncbi:MAG: CoA transferase [Bacteroidetes bacterium]|nr:CoA transferase [Bacteroidota bacterium]